MSYGITPIAVSIDKVESVMRQRKSGGVFGHLIGSPSAKVSNTIKQRFAYRFEQDDADDDEPTLEQALTDLLAGNDLNPWYGHKYAYAFELLCQHFGELLDNSAWSLIRSEWAVQVRDAMSQAGVDHGTFSMTGHLMYRGAPISIPPPDDFPFIGFLRKEEIGKALRAIDSADLTKMDEEVEESVVEIRGWLDHCWQLNCDLVCFYY